jgi:hypothetical protein
MSQPSPFPLYVQGRCRKCGHYRPISQSALLNHYPICCDEKVEIVGADSAISKLTDDEFLEHVKSLEWQK